MKLLAAVVPNLTPVTPAKFVPATVTVWPPSIGPPAGSTALTVGAAVLKLLSCP